MLCIFWLLLHIINKSSAKNFGRNVTGRYLDCPRTLTFRVHTEHIGTFYGLHFHSRSWISIIPLKTRILAYSIRIREWSQNSEMDQRKTKRFGTRRRPRQSTHGKLLFYSRIQNEVAGENGGNLFSDYHFCVFCEFDLQYIQ